MPDSASDLRPKRKSVAAESAFIGAAGQTGLLLGRPRAPSYSDFAGPVVDVLCDIAKIEMTETGVFTIRDAEPQIVTLASDTPDELPLQNTLLGLVAKPAYGTGLIGIGKTKRTIYVCCLRAMPYVQD